MKRDNGEMWFDVLTMGKSIEVEVIQSEGTDRLDMDS